MADTGSKLTLEKLRHLFTEAIPSALQTKFGHENLPFALDLVRQITEEHLSSLQHVFDLPDAHRYHRWSDFYLGVNWRYLEGKQLSAGRKIGQFLRKQMPAEHLSEVFFYWPSRFCWTQGEKTLIQTNKGIRLFRSLIMLSRMRMHSGATFRL